MISGALRREGPRLEQVRAPVGPMTAIGPGPRRGPQLPRRARRLPQVVICDAVTSRQPSGSPHGITVLQKCVFDAPLDAQVLNVVEHASLTRSPLRPSKTASAVCAWSWCSAVEEPPEGRGCTAPTSGRSSGPGTQPPPAAPRPSRSRNTSAEAPTPPNRARHDSPPSTWRTSQHHTGTRRSRPASCESASTPC